MDIITSLKKTPAYIFDFDNFKNRCVDIKNIVGNNIELCYSMKANPFFIIDLPKCINKIEVCSHGEFYICQKQKIDPQTIFYSGVNKKFFEVEEAIVFGVNNFTVESQKHLNILKELSEKYNKKLNIYFRLCSDSQFGIVFQDILEYILKKDKFPYLYFKGIHFFSGTQKKNSNIILEELKYLKDIVLSLKEKYNFIVEEVEYGTGLYIEYFGDTTNKYSQLEEIMEGLNDLQSITKLTIEMGRYFSATSGYYISKIDDVKINDGINYLIIDGGINQLVYDGQLKGMRKPKIKHIKLKKEKELTDLWTICGSLCTTNDVIVRDYPLVSPVINDLLIFYNVGAYSFMEGMSVFLSREMPEIIGIKNKELFLLREMKQTFTLNTVNNCEMVPFKSL